MSLLPPAPAFDVVRAQTKDDECIAQVQAHVRDLLVHVLPNSLTSHPLTHPLVVRLSRFLYYAATPRGALHATPGEEYASLVRAHPVRAHPVPTAPLPSPAVTTLRLPSASNRLLLAALHAVLASDAERIVRALWRLCVPRLVRALARLQPHPTHQPHRNRHRYRYQHEYPRAAVAALLDAARRAHLALFYWRPAFFTVAARLAAARLFRAAAPDPRAPPPLGTRLLAVAVALQLASDAARALRAALRRARADLLAHPAHPAALPPATPAPPPPPGPSARGAPAAVAALKDTARRVVTALLWPDAVREREPDDAGRGDKRCTLCLEGVVDPTLTQCGHVFCWDCICNWCASNDACPLCRRDIQAKKFVCLYNY